VANFSYDIDAQCFVNQWMDFVIFMNFIYVLCY
jgi:hypothetical protein